MPDIKVYLRADDVDKWNAIEKKAEWLHNALNQRNTVTIPKIEVAPPSYKLPTTKVPNPFDESKGIPNTSETTASAQRLAQGTCKIHGIPLDSRGKCLQKGCKYA